MKKQFRSLVSGVAITALGRRNVVRLARALAMEARLDVSNDIDSNGEVLVQLTALQHAATSGPRGRTVVIDAGANVGHWSQALARTAHGVNVPGLEVIAFEPVAHTFRLLSEAIAGLGSSIRARAVNEALSDQAGTADMQIVGEGAGTNSLHVQTDIRTQRTETITCTTLDGFCASEGIDRVLLLKIDTEGHEMSVLGGAAEMLKRQAVDLIQFEYNHRWIASRHYLRDAFELLQPLGYSIGKVTPKGIEFYGEWHFELESWYEGNYLACLEPWKGRFATVDWWRNRG